MKIYKEFISDQERTACPINESIQVLTHADALKMLHMDVWAMKESYITPMHKELLHNIFQRMSMAKNMLLTPNICAELFTLDEYTVNNRYIINKLVGRHDLNGQRIWDIEPLERQTYRKLLKLTGDYHDYLLFFWNRLPNAIYRKEGTWRFIPESPAYKSLLEVYAKYKLLK